MKDHTQSAGDNSSQYQAARDITNITNITNVTLEGMKELPREQVREIALETAVEVFEKNAPILREGAARIIEERVTELSDDIVERMIGKGTVHLERFGDPRFLAALLSAQRSYAETGDQGLSAILAGLVSNLATEPIRSRREIVMRLSIECAPRLTSAQLNALVVLVYINNRTHYVDHFDPLPARLDAGFRPYYGLVPDSAFDYQYMASTEAGSFFGGIAPSPYKVLYKRYMNTLYPPFTLSDLPGATSDFADDTELMDNLQVIPEDRDVTEFDQRRFRLRPDVSTSVLSELYTEQKELTGKQKGLREFILSRSMDGNEFKRRLTRESPDLGQFLDLIEETRAMDFELSPVGLMLARHTVSEHSPRDAEQIDSMFDV